MENLIPFKVEPLPLPEGVEFYRVYRKDESKEIEARILGKIYIVVAIKPNPLCQLKFGTGGALVEPYFDERVPPPYCSYHLPGDLFLLVRDGEVPVWWPSIYCKARKHSGNNV